jgi:uncharacterized C2H2 Zn-finger protein
MGNSEGCLMAKCPRCKIEVAQPTKALKNHAFSIESYTCTKCNNIFKVIKEYYE